VGAALPAGYIAPSLLQDDATRVAEAVRVGPGLMPQFPRSALTDQQVNDIVAYVQALPAHENDGGWPIGDLGPVAEGLFGWVAGLGLLLVVIRLLGKRAAQ
jgi:ubiquinol-cytochrome c reductase cytochrome c subunit